MGTYDTTKLILNQSTVKQNNDEQSSEVKSGEKSFSLPKKTLTTENISMIKKSNKDKQVVKNVTAGKVKKSVKNNNKSKTRKKSK